MLNELKIGDIYHHPNDYSGEYKIIDILNDGTHVVLSPMGRRFQPAFGQIEKAIREGRAELVKKSKWNKLVERMGYA